MRRAEQGEKSLAPSRRQRGRRELRSRGNPYSPHRELGRSAPVLAVRVRLRPSRRPPAPFQHKTLDLRSFLLLSTLPLSDLGGLFGCVLSTIFGRFRGSRILGLHVLRCGRFLSTVRSFLAR